MASKPADAGLRAKLVGELSAIGVLDSPSLTEAFATVPRHVFLPHVPLEQVYANRSHDLKRDGDALTSSSTPPSMMAIMLAQLDVRRGDHVLEIGTGSGYNAAMLSHLAGPDGHVTTIEFESDLAESARAALDAAGHARTDVVCGDGRHGWTPHAPYDRVIATTCLNDIPAPLWDQLAPSGKLVVPLALRQTQTAIAFEKRGTLLSSLSSTCCSFVHVRASGAWPIDRRELDGLPGATLEACPESRVDADAVLAALFEPTRDCGTGVHLSVGEFLFGLRLWLELELPGYFEIAAAATALGSLLVPRLVTLGNTVSTGFVQDAERSLAALVLPKGEEVSLAHANDVGTTTAVFEFQVRQFGDRESAAKRLLDSVQAWDRAGRPFRGISSALKVTAHRLPADSAATARLVLDRTETRFLVDWR